MAKIPYYGLSQGSIGQVRLEPIEDRYAGLRKGINTLQKFVDQRDAVEASKLLAEARSTWNIRLNDLQKEKGLDAEGFSTMVEQQMIDYESEIMSRVPYSQRDKFSAQFAGVKYDVLTKSSLYEADALSKKMVNGVNETLEYNANSILSDFTQRQKITDDTDDLIDDLDIADSVKDELKKEARSKYALSEIKALTELDANALLYNLNSGLYDRDITSQQKAAALSSANTKIEQNERELKIRKAEALNEEFVSDMTNIMEGRYDEVDIQSLLPKYVSDPKLFNALNTQFDKLKKDGFFVQDTSIRLNEGKIDITNKDDKKGLNMLFDTKVRELGDSSSDFSSVKKIADDILGKSGGFVPDKFGSTLRSMMNSNDYGTVAQAGQSFYEMKMINGRLETNLEDWEQDKLYIIGLAMNSGYSAKDIVDNVRVDPTEMQVKARESKYKDMFKKGDVKGSLDVNDPAAYSVFSDIYQKWYIQTGDADLARKMGEDYINTNYEINGIGTGKAGIFEFDAGDISLSDDKFSKTIRAKRVPIFQGPMQVYGRSLKGSASERQNVLARDLLSSVREILPDAEYENITITNTNKNFVDGKPVYLVSYRGVPLVDGENNLIYWRPNVVKYLEKTKEGKN
jgi:hypothetical protein